MSSPKPAANSAAAQPPLVLAPEEIDAVEWFTYLTGADDEPSFRNTAFSHVNDPAPHDLPGYKLVLRNEKTGDRYQAGRLSIATIGDLERVANSRAGGRARKAPCEVEFVTGKDWEALATKVSVSAQQADPANAGAVFQAASNFNAVESVSDMLAPDTPGFTENYVYDRTQGPAASVSAGPAAIARVHAAFYDPKTDPKAWRQTKAKQIELLGELKEYFPVQNGYVVLTGKERALPRDERERGALLRKVRIALHTDAQVTFGNSDSEYVMPVVGSGHHIDQVFCAALNVGQDDSGDFNSTVPDCNERIKFILQAAYEGTYLSAIVNRRKTVFLTLIGGGVFHNPLPLIAEAIRNAHVRWTSHPASEIESVKITMWNREPSEDFVAMLRASNIPVRRTVFEGSTVTSTIEK
eukprot:m51a1_g3471 hypothetical protein (410) ;mRNA; f:745988-747517